MMKRRDWLRTLGAAGAATAVGRWQGPTAAEAQPLRPVFPSGRASDLASRLTASIEKFKVPGASAAVFQDGKWEIAAAGITNVTTDVAVTPETVMHIGSITKVLNATLVMQLVDEGLIELGAPLKRYVPDFRVADRDASERITVEMLLNHTSGIDGEIFPDAGPDAERIEDAIPRIAGQGQIHDPGAELSYCNSGVVLAGYLAERLTGKSWYTLMKERIFEPLEMHHSVVLPADALLHRATVGHFMNPDGTNTRTSFAFLPQSFAPAGATAMTSAKDLATFALAHLNDGVAENGHRLLSANSARRMRGRTASWSGVGFAGMGLGWMLLDDGGVSHGGGGPGIISTLFADPSSNSVVAVLSNAAHGGQVLNEIGNPVYAAAGVRPFGSDVAELAKQATNDAVDPTPYVGRYESVATGYRVVRHEQGIALRARQKFMVYDVGNLEESPPAPLRPIRDGHFAVGSGVITFLNPRPDGRMQHVAAGGRLFRRTD